VGGGGGGGDGGEDAWMGEALKVELADGKGGASGLWPLEGRRRWACKAALPLAVLLARATWPSGWGVLGGGASCLWGACLCGIFKSENTC
jgi:hypothetical protein